MKIHYINHASVLIELGDIRLLSDPWYFGECFESGWGLRFNNGRALELAASATHMWISHFHGDHFHVPTLKRVLEVNPDVVVYGNHSFNFQLDVALERIGFRNVVRFDERTPVQLSDDVEITRYPTTGIDNMLLIRSTQGTILNYNDCNIPPRSRRMLRRKFGHIDVFLTNFNHAGKLLIYPFPGDEEVIRRIKRAFRNNYMFFEPAHVFPFASYHYYKAPESFHQNSAMITSAEDLATIDERILRIEVGDVFSYTRSTGHTELEKQPVKGNELVKLARASGNSFVELQDAGQTYAKQLKRQYGVFARLLPKFYIHVADLDITALFTIKDGLVEVDDPSIVPHITAHSAAIFKWFDKVYGTDSLVVGAHFEISHENKIPLKWQIVFGLLIDNRLDLRSLVRMCFTAEGLRFLFNRREEILGILTSFQLAAEYHD